MTEQELQKENEKLTARLKKAVDVFNEQKATITRLTEEVESLKAKAAEAEKHDDEFFDQVNEIESLKASLTEANAKIDYTQKQLDDTTARLEKAGEEYKKLKNEYNEKADECDRVSEQFNKAFAKIEEIRKILG